MIRVTKIYSIFYTKKFSLLFNQLFPRIRGQENIRIRPGQTGFKWP